MRGRRSAIDRREGEFRQFCLSRPDSSDNQASQRKNDQRPELSRSRHYPSGTELLRAGVLSGTEPGRVASLNLAVLAEQLEFFNRH